MPRSPGTVWPSANQELLLRAALADPSTAVEAWERARPGLSLDELEPGSFALLPLIYRNLEAAGHADPDIARLKGIHRRTWVRNNLLLERTRATAEALEESGIRAGFLEGVVLAARFYEELGLRPTSFIDVLVGEHDLPHALRAVARAGWAEKPDRAAGRNARYVFDAEGNVCVLRTALAGDVTRRAADDQSHPWPWDAGERFSLGETVVPVPPPTELLFAACVLHTRVGSRPNLQWIVDAKRVLAAGIDWEHHAALARESGQVSRLRDALALLGRLPGPTPPREACDRLAAIRVGRRERLAYLSTVGAIKAPGALPLLVGEHLAETADRSVLGAVAAFPGFLRERWELGHTRQVPLAAAKRALRAPRRSRSRR